MIEQINWLAAALIVVDVQRDFCPGGALPVPKGDEIIPFVNQLVQEAKSRNVPILFSKDSHPPTSKHFTQWPVHCVKDTKGEEFHPDLVMGPANIVVKGTSDADDYSAFDGRLTNGDFLDEFLRKHNIRRLNICGLATDYCVKETALDGIVNGYAVTVLKDGCRAVNVNEGDEEKAWKELDRFGAEIL